MTETSPDVGMAVSCSMLDIKCDSVLMKKTDKILLLLYRAMRDVRQCRLNHEENKSARALK